MTAPLPLNLEGLLCTADDIVLNFLCKYGELCTIACYTNNQILVLFRMSLSFQKGLFIDNVELYVHSFVIKVGTNHRCESL